MIIFRALTRFTQRVTRGTKPRIVGAILLGSVTTNGTVEAATARHDSPESTNLVVLFDASGALVRHMETLQRQERDYWPSLIDQRLPSWLESRTSGHVTEGDFLDGGNGGSGSFNWSGFYYGLPKNGSWKDFVHQLEAKSPRDFLSSFGQDFFDKNKSSTRFNWGVVSAATPLALASLAAKREEKGGSDDIYDSIYILNITDNESARDNNNPQFNEIYSLDRVATSAGKPKDFQTLRQSLLDASRAYALFGHSGMALFPAGNSEVIDDPGSLVGACEGRNDCLRGLTATLTRLEPARRPDPSQHFTLAKAIRFAFTDKGYEADLILTRHPDQDPDYVLTDVCVSLLNRDGSGEDQRCEEDQGKDFHFHFVVPEEEEASDAESLLANRVQVTGIYRYTPPSMDVGLRVKTVQTQTVPYDSPPTYPDGSPITRATLKANPGSTVEDLRGEWRARKERNDALVFYGSVLAALVCVALLALAIARYRARHPKADVRLEIILTDGESPLTVNDDGSHPPVHPSSGLIQIDLNTPRSAGEVHLGYVRLSNHAKPNMNQALRPLYLKSIQVSVTEDHPAGLHEGGAMAPFTLGSKSVQEGREFTGVLEWPLFLHPSALPNFNNLPFTTGSWRIGGEIQAIVQVREKSGVETPQDLPPLKLAFFTSGTVQPCQYQFTLSGEVSDHDT